MTCDGKAWQISQDAANSLPLSLATSACLPLPLPLPLSCSMQHITAQFLCLGCRIILHSFCCLEAAWQQQAGGEKERERGKVGKRHRADAERTPLPGVNSFAWLLSDSINDKLKPRRTARCDSSQTSVYIYTYIYTYICRSVLTAYAGYVCGLRHVAMWQRGMWKLLICNDKFLMLSNVFISLDSPRNRLD